MSIQTTDEKYVALIDSVTEIPLPMPTFGSESEAFEFVQWQHDIDLRRLDAHQLADLRTVWSRVWAGMALNPDHEHSPGCEYQQRCSDCDWTGNWGDGDNAFYRGWDHSHDHPETRGHRTVTVHK